MTGMRLVARALWLGVLLCPFALGVPFAVPYAVALIPVALAASEEAVPGRWRQVLLVVLPLALVGVARWPFVQLAHGSLGEAAVVVSAGLGYLAFRLAEGRERLVWLLLLGGAIMGLHARLSGSGALWLAAYVATGGAVFLVDELAAPGVVWVSALSRLGAAATGTLAFVVGAAVLFAGVGTPPAAGAGGLSGSPSGGTAATPIPVGRPISPSTDAIIRIAGAPSAAYWQEAVYGSYADGVWSTSPGSTVALAAARASLPPMDGASAPASVTTWQVLVTYLTRASLPLVYAGRPTAISVVDGPAIIHVATGAAEILAPGTSSYDLTLAMPTLDVGALAAAPFPKGATGADVAVPPAIRPRITRLARLVTQGATTPWQAAQDITAYLDAHEKYSTSFAAQPSAAAVPDFLFKTHVGDCDQFSTAFVLMMRSLGVPANWVVGFAPGVYDPTTKTETLRAMDEHSWAEVDFGTAGWAPVDPTPGYSFLTLPGTRPAPARQPAPASAPSPTPLWPAGVAAVLLGAVALGLWKWRHRQPEGELWDLLATLAARRGATGDGLTPRTVAHLCTEGERHAILPAVELLEGSWYGGRPVDPGAVADAVRRLRVILRSTRA